MSATATRLKKWSMHYLNILFFKELLKTDYKKKVVLIQAFDKTGFLGCSIHFKSKTLLEDIGEL